MTENELKMIIFCTFPSFFLHNPKFFRNFATEFAKVTKTGEKTMARPIAETPILYGEDASRFMHNMRHVQKISAEEKERMRKSYEWVKSISTFPF